MTSRHQRLAAQVGLLVLLSGLTSSCQGFPFGFSSKNASSINQTPIPISSSSSNKKTYEPSFSSTVASASPKDQHTVSRSDWSLAKGLFGLANVLWLGLASIFLGCVANVIAFTSLARIKQLQSILQRRKADVERNANDIIHVHQQNVRLKSQVDTFASKLSMIQASHQEMQQQNASLSAVLNTRRNQQIPAQVNDLATSPYHDGKDALSTQIASVTPQQELAELTAAVNRGDPQVIKLEKRLQVNITKTSENAISMSRLNDTQLEPVVAGGSYWVICIGEQYWLYPTKQTLNLYSEVQRPTGIYSYVPHQVTTPQVIAPARLNAIGDLWQVVEAGSIAVPL